MGYVAVKGGTEAVLQAEQLVEYFRLKGGTEPITGEQIQDQMRLAVDRAMNEGSLYAPELAALALKQSEGDALEASFLLRAYRSTLPRLAYSLPVEGVSMRPVRRISATFKDIPGGQILGPSRDYNLRLLNTALEHESGASVRAFLAKMSEQVEREMHATDHEPLPVLFPKVIEYMRTQQMLAEIPESEQEEAQAEPYDVTRRSLTFPAPRSARLQVLARGDVGSLLTFAYSSVRGYGDAHPTLGELRFGYLPIEVTHPITGEAVAIGEVLATECEIVSRVHAEDENHNPVGEKPPVPTFGLGYGFCFGHAEVKAMSMAMLDRVLSAAKEVGVHGETGPAANEEFVLLHIDGIEASGFIAHYKLPHYVSFQADISVLERTQSYQASKFAERFQKNGQQDGML